MEKLVRIALRVITFLILLATVVSFSESYHGLFEWAISHSVPWFWSLIWPLMLDTVILVGECSVFVSIHKHWKLRHRIWAWSVTFSGLAVSTLANGGHVASKDWLTHLTNALPPIALMFALTVGLGVLKRVRMKPGETSQPALTETPEKGHLIPPAYPLSEMVEAASQTALKFEGKTSQPTEHHHVEGNVWAPAERPAPSVPDALPQLLSETLIKHGFKVTEKSYSKPKDPRTGLSLQEARVRDMYDVDPEITANSISKALGIAWATADKHLKATKAARGEE